MATMRQKIERWLRGAKRSGYDYLIVVCDTYDYVDYPVHVSREDFWEEYDKLYRNNMQRIIEVYDLSMNIVDQLKEHRAMHCPPRETGTVA